MDKPTPDPRSLELVMQLMAIPGGSGDEAKVAEFIQTQLKKVGISPSDFSFDQAHKKSPTQGQLGNMALKLPGTIKGPRRLLMAHMDTVPICIGSRPVRKGGYVRSGNPDTGLGADNRAGCAVVLNTALTILRERRPHPPLTFLWTVQEEIGLFGARFIKKSMLGKPALAFNWDGGNPTKVTLGATGGYRLQINIDGIASHAGNTPQNGVSAIAIAGLAIADLQQQGWHGLIQKGKKRGTSNVGIIQGGDATNVVTDHVYLKAEARSHDSKFRERIVREIEKAFSRACKSVKSADGKTGRVRIDGQLDYDSFRLDPSEPSVQAAVRAIEACGQQPEMFVSNGGVDANWMSRHGIPTVTLGCGQMNPHMTTEQLDIAAYETACQIGLQLGEGLGERRFPDGSR
ncbi:MAG: M20/M25/M40 family metallo-hydrolase [Planctomycetota bacterium]